MGHDGNVQKNVNTSNTHWHKNKQQLGRAALTEKSGSSKKETPNLRSFAAKLNLALLSFTLVLKAFVDGPPAFIELFCEAFDESNPVFTDLSLKNHPCSKIFYNI